MRCSECRTDKSIRFVRGLCHRCYSRLTQNGGVLREKDPGCSVGKCERPHYARGFCKPHYYRRDKTDEKIRVMGAGHVTPGGYRTVQRPGHPNAGYHGQIFEHRWIMSESIGRPLAEHETVHHKNGQRADNRLKKGHEFGGCPSTCCNLELWSSRQPGGQRVADLLAWANEILAIYEKG